VPEPVVEVLDVEEAPLELLESEAPEEALDLSVLADLSDLKCGPAFWLVLVAWS
jgi:hypothetical protein